MAFLLIQRRHGKRGGHLLLSFVAIGRRSGIDAVILGRRTLRNGFYRVSDDAIVIYGLDLVEKVGLHNYLHRFIGRPWLADAQESKNIFFANCANEKVEPD